MAVCRTAGCHDGQRDEGENLNFIWWLSIEGQWLLTVPNSVLKQNKFDCMSYVLQLMQNIRPVVDSKVQLSKK